MPFSLFVCFDSAPCQKGVFTSCAFLITLMLIQKRPELSQKFKRITQEFDKHRYALRLKRIEFLCDSDMQFIEVRVRNLSFSISLLGC